MNFIRKTFWYIQAIISRILPLLLFLIIHAVGEIYVYNWNPLDLISVNGIIENFGLYLYLYLALGIIVLALFFMNYSIAARIVMIGVFFAQYELFKSRWYIYIQDLKGENPYGRFYLTIFLSIVVGFSIQMLWKNFGYLFREYRYKKAIKR